MVKHNAALNVQGYDIDESALRIARTNMKLAGLRIRFISKEI